jgi:hypothetical protein
MGSRISEDLVDLFEGGVSILVGTRDAALRPEATRGVGALVHPDRARLTVFLPDSVSARAVENLRHNGVVAVGFSRLHDHHTVQVKGKVESLVAATEADREIVKRYHLVFAEVLSIVGIPRTLVRLLNTWPCQAVTFEVTDIFLQTPGPNAGQRLNA